MLGFILESVKYTEFCRPQVLLLVPQTRAKRSDHNIPICTQASLILIGFMMLVVVKR